MSSDSSARPQRNAAGQRQSLFVTRLVAARAGSETAMAELLETCRHYLLLAANRGIGPELQGKLGGSDLVQETIFQAHLRFDRFRGATQGELLAWTGRILQNKLIHEFRRYQGTLKRDARREIQLRGGDMMDAIGAVISADDPSPSAIAIAKEEAIQLKNAIEQLAPEYRQVLVLRNWERLPFAEIAIQMERSQDAVFKLWTRAVLQLQRRMTAHGD